MEYIWIVGVALLAYLAYHFYIKPMRIRAYYIKIFKDLGYKVFVYPYSFLAPPFLGDWMENQKNKNDFSYTGKHVYSDNYDLAVSNVFSRPEIVFFNEKLIKGYLDKNIQMKLPKMNTGFDIFCYIINRGLIFIQKNTWRHRRTLLSKVFNFDFIISQIPTMIQSADLIFDRFQEEFWKSHPQKRTQKQINLSLYGMIAKYTSTIIMAGFLGLDSMKEQLKGVTIQQQILKLCDDSIASSRDFLNLMFGENFLKLGLRKKDRQIVAFNKEINQILRTYINNYRLKRQQKQERTNQKLTIIQLILQEIQKEKKSGNNQIILTDDDLIDQIKTFVIAGTDTTSNYLTMLLLYIYEHKEVLQKLRKEIAKHIHSDEDITYENIKKIGYLDNVMSQSSRMFGTAEATFERVLQEDSSICDIPVFKGTCFNVFTRPMVSNPKNFEEPFKFKPQRWQIQTEQNKRLLQMVALQFYGGPRGCIGKQLALTESKVGVVKFLRRYQSLVEPGIKNRGYALELVSHLVNSDVILQKS